MRPLYRSILVVILSTCLLFIFVVAPSAGQSSATMANAASETIIKEATLAGMTLPQSPVSLRALSKGNTFSRYSYLGGRRLNDALLPLSDSPQYYYATRIVDTQRIGYTESPLHQFGVIRWTTPENLLGSQDNVDAELLNSTHTDQACIIVSFGGTLTLSNGDVQAYVHQPQGLTTDMGIEIDAADDLLSCNSSGWTQVYSYHEVGGPQSGGPGWYGTTYTGKVRALRILVSSAGGNGLNGDRYFYVDSIRLYATSFVPDSLAFDQTLSPNECPFCGSAELNHFVGGPVNTNSGNYNYQATDLAVSALGQPLQFERSYNSLVSNIVTNTASYSLPLGYGWTHNYDTKLIFPGDPDGESGTVILKAPHGSRMRFNDGTYAPLPGVLATMTRTAVTANTYVYTVTARNLETFVFTNTGQIIAHLDPLGHKTTFAYTGTLLARVSDSTGLRYLSFGYDLNGRLISVSDQSSRNTRYNYDPNGNLASVIDTRSLTWTYQYSGTTHLLARVIDPDGHTVERTDYDGQGRAIRQFRVNDGIDELALQIDYGANGAVTVTDGLSNQTVDFYSNGIWIASTDASRHTITRFYNKDLQPAFVVDQNGNGRWNLWGTQGNVPASVVYAPGISITNKFDALGNVTRTIDARGYATVFTYTGSFLTRKTNALTNTWIYTPTSDGRNLLAAELAPSGRLTEYHYDQFGQRDMMTDALTNVTRYSYDSIGRLISTTVNTGQPAYERTTLNRYDGAGNLISTTVNFNPNVNADPRLYNLTTLYGYDGAGRQIAITDTIGRITRNYYNDAGQLISTTANFTITPGLDPNLYNLTTRYGYDRVGNRVLVTDTRSLVTKTDFDNLNRPITVTTNYVNGVYDPAKPDEDLVHVTHYDPAGNVIEQIEMSSSGALDRVTRTWYDNLNRPITVTRNYDPLLPPNYNGEYNLTTVTTYDLAGNAVAVRDPLGHLSTFGYDALNRLISTTNALTGTTRYEYDAVGNRIIVTDVLTRATRYEYDQLNRLITTTLPDGSWTVNTYDAAGNRVRVTDALGHATVYTYNLRGQLIAQAVAGLGLPTTSEYDRIGNRVAVTDANGIATRYQYDIAGHLIVMTQSYTTTAGLDPDAYNIVTRYRYDKAGNVISTTNPLTATTVYTYDALSRLVAQTDALTRTWRYAYDRLGNRTVITDAQQQITRFSYDAANRLTTIAYPTDTVRYQYDALGNRSVMTDALGVSTFRYDDLSRLIGHTDPFSQIITYTYDAYGNITNLRYPDGKTITYTHDAANRITATLNWAGQATTYDYDTAGRLVTTTLPNGVMEVNTYDDANRVKRLTHSLNGMILADYQFTLDKVGNRTRVTETLRQPTTQTWVRDTSVFTVTQSTNDAYVGTQFGSIDTTGANTIMGRPRMSFNSLHAGYRFNPVTLPAGSTLVDAELYLQAYTDDGSAAALEVYGEASSTPAAYSTYADFMGRALTKNLIAWTPDAWKQNEVVSVGVTDLIQELMDSYWQSGNPLALQVRGGGSGTRQAWSVDGDSAKAARLLLTYDRLVTDSPSMTTTIQYAYDPLYRLTNANYSGAYTYTFGYAYDAMSNRTAQTATITSTVVTTYTYDAANQLRTAKANNDGTTWYYTYDANGNLREMTPNGTSPTNGALRYTYDASNRLNKAETYSGAAYATLAQMTYDGLGNRARLVGWVSGVAYTTTYATRIVGQIQILQASSGGVTTTYWYGVGAIGEYGSSTSYYLVDGNGSVRQVTDQNGSVTFARYYDPFGQLLTQNGSGNTLYGYLGAQFDQVLGLMYINGAYYDPVTGRFLSPVGDGQNPYVPLGGAALAPILILALIGRKKKGKIWTGWLVVALMVSAGLTMAACGGQPAPQPAPTTPRPITTPPTPTSKPVAVPPSVTPTPSPVPLPPTPPQCPTPPSTSTPLPSLDQGIANRARITADEINTAGSMENYLRSEDDATLLTRVSMGESPASADDRKYVMWIVKIRTMVAFSVNVPSPGQTTTVQDEVFASGQFATIQAILGVTDPRAAALGSGPLACGGHLNRMIYPCDTSGLNGVAANPDAPDSKALAAWQQTYYDAQNIVNAQIDQMPVELRGYDSFLAAGSGGHQFFPGSNDYFDRTSRDNDLFSHLTPTP
jgi:RHS repeat-associated protein